MGTAINSTILNVGFSIHAFLIMGTLASVSDPTLLLLNPYFSMQFVCLGIMSISVYEFFLANYSSVKLLKHTRGTILL